MTSAAYSEERRRAGRLPQPSAASVRSRVALLAAAVAVIVVLVTVVPGLASLRSRFAHASAGWLALGVALKALSLLSYVAIFRAVFCRRMSWRLSLQIGLAELGANAIFPTGGAGGLALGAWALRRRGMPGERIARRTVAFFLLTSIANVSGVIVLGVCLAFGLFAHVSPALSIVPAVVAALAVVAVLAAGPIAERAGTRLSAAQGRRARLGPVVAAIGAGVREALALLREHDPWLVIGAIGYLGFDVMILWATFHAFGSVPPLAIIWIGYLIGELGGLVPLPAGLGGVDLGLVGTLVAYGVSLTSATAAVLAYRAIALWLPAVVGGAAFLILRRTLRRDDSALGSGEPVAAGAEPTQVA